MNVLLDQLDISWLDPDPTTTLDILNIILTFVKSFESDKVENVKIANVDKDDGDGEGVLARLILGKILNRRSIFFKRIL